MLRLLLRLVPLGTALFVLPFLWVRAWPADDSALRELLSAPEDCAMPCFLGIRPGITTVTEATALLNAHPWIDQVQVDGYQVDGRGLRAMGWLTWTWSAAHPDMIDGSEPGRMYFAQEDNPSVLRVQSVQFRTRLRAYQVQQWYGQPIGSFVTLHERQLNYVLSYPADGQRGMIDVAARMNCPVDLLDYWNSGAQISLRPMYSVGTYEPLTAVVRLC